MSGAKRLRTALYARVSTFDQDPKMQLHELTRIEGRLVLRTNETLTSLAGLNGLTHIGGDLVLISNGASASLAGLDPLTHIGGEVIIGVYYGTEDRGNQVFVADLDGDNDPDLVVGYGELTTTSRNISVLLNRGDGPFANKVDYATSEGASSVFAADLDGDGDPDLAVGNERRPTVMVLSNLSDRSTAVNEYEDQAALGPATHVLFQNHPNPFNPSTQLAYQLSAAGKVTLVVYNLMGQRVRTLDQGFRTAGYYQVTWDGRNEEGQAVSSGVYIYRLTSEAFTQTHRMLLLK